jgi:micrococcal nuclease
MLDCNMRTLQFPRLAPCQIAPLLLATLFLIGPQVHAAKGFAGQVTYVSDGDTLWVQPDAGGPPRKLRIDGIDAPEICQAGGEAARAVLIRRALHQQVEVQVIRHDVYGRGLARLQIHGDDLGAQLVQEGQAWSYRWRGDAGPYAAQEAVARQSRLGLFAFDAPEVPRDFRKRHGSCYSAK